MTYLPFNKDEPLVPAYIEAGVDSWSGQPLNDKEMLYKKYGDKIRLGIDPDIALTPTTPDEDASALARRLVAKYGPTMAEKPFSCSAMFMTRAFRETLYEESRKMFN